MQGKSQSRTWEYKAYVKQPCILHAGICTNLMIARYKPNKNVPLKCPGHTSIKQWKLFTKCVYCASLGNSVVSEWLHWEKIQDTATQGLSHTVIYMKQMTRFWPFEPVVFCPETTVG